jgi:hypothetical protein
MRRWHWVGAAVFGGLLLTSGARAANQELVRRAVHKGVKLLKRVQGKDGTWFHQDQPLGMTALAGLTLLECGEPPSEAHVQAAAKTLRLACADQQKVHQTYTIALAVMFFDRLGEPGDEPLIQALTMRLMAGQNGSGGWDYGCPALPDDFYRKLTAGLQQAVLKVRDPAADKHEPPPRADRQEVLQITGKLRNTSGGDNGDNSNTQFATLGLWVARRHGQPVDDCLLEVARHFKETQHADGGWSYRWWEKKSATTDTMTCAGLIGLAVGHGVRVAARADARAGLAKDRSVLAGLLCLAGHVGQPILMLSGDTRAYYFFWSLERVAVIYRLPTIGRHNWYNWVAGILLRNQQDNGAWYGEFSKHDRRAMVADTCFALLALQRANVARDLSGMLQGDVTLKARQPGTATEDAPRAGPATAGSAPGGDDRAARLCADLVNAAPAEQTTLMEQYKTNKGAEYTQALATAIPQLSGTAQRDARRALAERLANKTAATLRGYLQDKEDELRYAAARAAYIKNQSELVPDLIELLKDANARIVAAAHQALRGISGKDFGPAARADSTERAAAAARWRAWWDSEGSKQQK